MENLYLEQDIKTPKLDFNFSRGELSIEGISVPENTIDFYSPFVFWVKEYVQNPKKTVLAIKLEYFNTSTSVVLLNIMRDIASMGREFGTIKWYYELDDFEMKEVGEDYKNMLDTNFELIPIELS
jgi:hypothetical protein